MFGAAVVRSAVAFVASALVSAPAFAAPGPELRRTPEPTPAPSPRTAPATAAPQAEEVGVPAAPEGLRAASSRDECLAHLQDGPDGTCDHGYRPPGPRFTLIWNQPAPLTAIAGARHGPKPDVAAQVWRVDRLSGTARALVGRGAQGLERPDDREPLGEPRPGGAVTLAAKPGDCFAITLWVAGRQSPPSNVYCATDADVAVLRTVSLNPIRKDSYGDYASFGQLPPNQITNPSGPENHPTELLVGWFDFYQDLRHESGGNSGDYWQQDHVSRAVVVYSLQWLAGHEIASAELVLNADAWDSGDQPLGGKNVDEPMSCTRYLGALSNLGPPPESATWRDVDIGLSPKVVDVTDIVIAWTSGAMPNNGFVLKGEKEDLKVVATEGCMSFYPNMPLVVRYY
jgi:hypothetical protein